MHPNPIYHQDDDALAFARARGFGILSINGDVGNGDVGPLMAHVPFIMNDAGTAAYLHLVRSNPIWRRIENPAKAVIAVSGGDAYISPDWYGIDDQVPTWNYVAVHLRGRVERMPEQDLRDILNSTSARFEPELLPKTPWTADKMSPDALARMMRQIVPVRLWIDEAWGTFKLSQNKPPDARAGVVDALASSPVGQDIDHIRQLMAADLKKD